MRKLIYFLRKQRKKKKKIANRTLSDILYVSVELKLAVYSSFLTGSRHIASMSSYKFVSSLSLITSTHKVHNEINKYKSYYYHFLSN